jgi:pyrrolidone-carboxylate peptidase
MISAAIAKKREQGYRVIAVLSLGECGGQKLRIEKKARNKRGKSQDEAKAIPGDKKADGSILPDETNPGGKEKYDSPLTGKIKDGLQDAGADYEESEDAGNYLCEEAFYSGLELTGTGGDAGPAGFVHIPQYPNSDKDKTDEDNEKRLREMKRAIQKVIEKIAANPP